MSFYDAIRVGSSAEAGDYEIERSLRFYSLASDYLNRTPSSSSNRKTFTISWWFKIGNIPASGAYKAFFGAYDNSTSGNDGYWLSSLLDSDGRLYMGAWTLNWRRTTRQFRDPSAWYHCIFAVDTTQATAADRIKIYVNGVEETSFGQNNNPSQNFDLPWNFSSVMQTIGRVNYTGGGSSPYSFDGYIAEFNSIDGLQLTPSSFGETNATTGQWIPKKYTGSYGTNGFYLNFSDNSGTTATTLGKDSSGNGNNFTPNNFSVAVGSAVNIKNNDSVLDTPTNNFPVLNPLNFNPFGVSNYVASSPVNGNLGWLTNTTSNVNYAESSMVFPNTGKWYLEVYVNNLNIGSGVGYTQITVYGNTGGSRYLWWVYASPYYQIATNSGTETIGSISNGDIIQVAYDSDTGNVWFGKNNTWYLSGDPANGTAMSPATTVANDYAKLYVAGRSGSAQNTLNVNFGQQGFLYTPPTGFKAISSKNIPDPTILLPNEHFNTLLYTGNGAASGHQITGLNFQPEWVWIKNRTQAYDHMLFDAVRGVGKYLEANDTTAEATGSHQESFDSNGFTVGAGNTSNRTNANNIPYVAWNWNAGDAASKTYRVVVVTDTGNKYRFRNSANSATFAQSAVTLDLEEGGTYTFDGSDSTMASHPIKLSTTANGTHGGGSSYNTGVTYELDGSTVTESAYVSGYSSATSRKLIITVAASAPTLYYYCHVHSGMGGQINTNSTKGSTNFDGSVLSIVKANTTAGFSIVTYTGNGSDGATIGHGLGVKPDFIVIKKRANNSGGNTGNWIGQHKSLTNGVNATSTLFTLTSYSSSAIYLNLTNGQSSYGFDNQVNGNTDTFVAYCFSEVAGYSKFGSYKGNGSTDGAFVHTGFRPALVITKQTNAAGSWFLFDNKRNGSNETEPYLMANVNNVEATDLGWDLLSNGFKNRNSYSATNALGSDYLYLAFAESPFKNNRAR
jgi:hypothetical protein